MKFDSVLEMQVEALRAVDDGRAPADLRASEGKLKKELQVRGRARTVDGAAQQCCRSPLSEERS